MRHLSTRTSPWLRLWIAGVLCVAGAATAARADADGPGTSARGEVPVQDDRSAPALPRPSAANLGFLGFGMLAVGAEIRRRRRAALLD